MLRSFTDLLANVLDRAEEETGLGQSEFQGLAAEFLDRVYFEILGRRPWMWSRSPAPFPLRVYAPIATRMNWAHGSYIIHLHDDLPDPVEHWKLAFTGMAAGRLLRRHATPNPPFFPMVAELPLFVDSLADIPVTAYKDEYAMLEIPDVPPMPIVGAVTQPGEIQPGFYAYSMAYVGSAGETVRGPSTTPILEVSEPSTITVTLPPHPAGNPYVVGRTLYRTGFEEYPGLIRRVYVSPLEIEDGPLNVQDNTPQPLTSDAPTTFGVNGTVRVRLIYGVYGRGTRREVDPMSEIKLRDAFHDPTAPRWPPLAYARTSQNVITLSHQPNQDAILDIYHTEIGKPLSLSSVNEIKIPPHYRHVLADAALALLLEQKHSDRAAVWLGRMKDHLLVMEAEDEKVKMGYDGLRRGIRHEAMR